MLAGRTKGTEQSLAENTALALAALDLATAHDIGPVLLCSSSAVYGAAPGPHREDAILAAATPYGRAKLAMEQAVARHAAPSCALRIANVAGADMALLNAAQGPVSLDRFVDKTTPLRMYSGPLSLARMMLALIDVATLPPVLNLAQPGMTHMGDLMDAANVRWQPRPAPDTALPALALNLTQLSELIPLTPATPESLTTEARLAGWRPA